MSILNWLEDEFKQPVSFSFKVAFVGSLLPVPDTGFQSVTGISSEMQTEEIREGGENRYVHQLPNGVKANRLVLKRGVASLVSPLVIWCKAVFESDLSIPIVPMPIMVYLLDEQKLPSRVWSFSGAWPIKWEVDEFNSTKNEVAIEEIELNYNYSKRVL
ncbi:phage tail protein [Zooshikella sp. RANM57]|uniref:phage tail protein n=1 Tax=Zooshikella sp. RANM57 TaxID=3425863 RepID=UPI003D6DE4B0